MQIGKIKRIVDIGMLLGMLLLMAFSVTEAAAHEWIGIGETILVVVHQILNRKWYGALGKGRYSGLRIFSTVVTLLLFVAFAGTAFSGMSMSGEAVPFLYGIGHLSDPQRLHLSLAHWSFVLMGIHVGLHIPAIVGQKSFTTRIKPGIAVILAMLPCYGLYRFIENDMVRYLLFQSHFAMVDFEKPGALVLVENLLMLLPWIFVGIEATLLFRRKKEMQ